MRKVGGILAIIAIYALITISYLNFFGVVALGQELPSAALTPQSKFWPGHYLGPQEVSGTGFSADITPSGEVAVIETRTGTPVGMRVAYGMISQNLLVRGNLVFVTGLFPANSGGPAADGFQIWDFTNPLEPIFRTGWRLPQEETMTSLAVAASSIYVTSYVRTDEFVESSRFHVVRSGESLWSITRDELCAGSETCTARRWVELVRLNLGLIRWVREPGGAIPVIYPGQELKVTPMIYDTTYRGTLWKLSFPGGVSSDVSVAAIRTFPTQKPEVVFPDTATIGTVNLWTTAADGTDRQYLLDGNTLKGSLNLRGD